MKAIVEDPWSLIYVPNHLKIKKTCSRAVEEDPYTLDFVPDHFKAPEMCERAVDAYPYTELPMVLDICS